MTNDQNPNEEASAYGRKSLHENKESRDIDEGADSTSKNAAVPSNRHDRAIRDVGQAGGDIVGMTPHSGQ
jgi:hypothetical protein